MLLISFASLAAMIIFMRLCSYSTPPSRAYYYYYQQPRGLPLAPPPMPFTAPRQSEPVGASPSPRPPPHQQQTRQRSQQPQGMPREHFVPSFRLKRRRTIDPVNGVEKHVSELIPASSVPLPYHRSRGGAVGVRSRPPPWK